MIKFVLIGLAILFLLPLLRRKEKPAVDAGASGDPKPLPPKAKALASKPKSLTDDDDDGVPAKGTFDALMRTVVLLVDNDWAGCTVDGVKENWPRFASEDVRGFSAVPAGRHRVVTEIDGRSATIDFVIFPGDVFVRRLDRDAMKWVELDADALASERARAEGGEKSAIGEALISYRSTMGIARVMSGKLASPQAAFEKAESTLSALVYRSTTEDIDAAVVDAHAAGEALIGVALMAAQLDALAALAKRDDVTKRIVEAALPGIASRVVRDANSRT